jgi:hypothetical protein
LQEVRVLVHVICARAFPPVKVDRSSKGCEALFAGMRSQMALFANEESKRRVTLGIVHILAVVFQMRPEVFNFFVSPFAGNLVVDGLSSWDGMSV